MNAEPFEFDPWHVLCTHCGQHLTRDNNIGQSRAEPQQSDIHFMYCPYCKTIIGYVIADNFDPASPYIKVPIITNGVVINA